MPLSLSPSRTIALCAVLAATVLAVLPAGTLPVPTLALALAVFGIGLWATGVLPEHLTALAFFTLAMLLGVAPAEVVFAGFQSAALWLIFGGLVIGVAVKRTGLGERLADRLARAFGETYPGVIAGVTAVGVLLGFLMPSSMGRVVLLLPIALAIADRFGFAEGSRGRTGVVMAAAFGCHVPTFAILPANVPNLIMMSAAESLYGYQPIYGEYLLLHFPVLGLLKSALIVGLVLWMFPDRPKSHRAPAIHGPMSGEEKRLALLLAVALAFWLTDFLHHVSPGWIGLAAGVICLLPAVGLVPGNAFNQQINFGSMFYVAGITGLGAIVHHSGLGGQIAGAFLAVLPLEPGQPVWNFISLAAVSTLLGPMVTLPGVPAVLTPLAGEMAQASGLPLQSVIMSQVLGFSTLILPYQSAPLVVALQIGGQSILAAQRMTLALAALTVAILFPLDYLWWQFLGWI